MKRVLFLVDAAGDFPYPELDDRTPLECARLTHAHAFASEGKLGALKVRHTGPDAARAFLAEAMGFSPRAAAKLRWGPLGVLAHGDTWEDGRIAYLAHFIHVDDDGNQHPVSPASLDEQKQLLRDLENELKETHPRSEVKLLGLSLGRFVITLSSAHHWMSASPVAYQYSGFLQRLDPVLRSVLEQIQFSLDFHPVNQLRLDLSEYPISAVWCWSGGHRIPECPSRPFSCALLSPDPFIKGLAELCSVPFATLPDPYHPSGQTFPEKEVRDLIARHDEVLIWLPAPFASEEFQEPQEKVRRIDEMDYRLLGPIRRIVENEDRVRLLLSAVGVRHRGRPERGMAPCLLWGSGVSADSVSNWTEAAGLEGQLGVSRWSSLLETFRKSS